MQNQSVELRLKVDETITVLRRKTKIEPRIGIILGTGLGEIANQIDIDLEISYDEIPNFPLSTVEFHKGKLIFGKLSGKDVVAMQGRFHYYEGYTMQEITFPVRVMKFLGVNTIIISNACGTMNPDMRAGEIMLIEDHINLLGSNPLVGINDEFFGLRFTDMSEPYSLELIQIMQKIANENIIKLHKGVYAAMTGPSLETRAEYKFLRIIGADVVGMSTIPECIVANQMNMKVLGLSVITDECYPETLEPINIDKILKNAASAEPSLIILIKNLLERLEI